MSLPEGLGDGATDNNVRCLIYEHLLMDGRGVQLNGPINGPVSFRVCFFRVGHDISDAHSIHRLQYAPR